MSRVLKFAEWEATFKHMPIPSVCWIAVENLVEDLLEDPLLPTIGKVESTFTKEGLAWISFSEKVGRRTLAKLKRGWSAEYSINTDPAPKVGPSFHKGVSYDRVKSLLSEGESLGRFFGEERAAAEQAVTLIAAVGPEGQLGYQGDLIYRSSEDMSHFRRTTKGGTVIMGRKTWDSLQVRPLPGRKCHVLSRSCEAGVRDGATWHTELSSVLQATSKEKEIFVIGGQEIYDLFMSRANRMILSVFSSRPPADRFFPTMEEISRMGFKKTTVPVIHREFSIVNFRR